MLFSCFESLNCSYYYRLKFKLHTRAFKKPQSKLVSPFQSPVSQQSSTHLRLQLRLHQDLSMCLGCYSHDFLSPSTCLPLKFNINLIPMYSTFFMTMFWILIVIITCSFLCMPTIQVLSRFVLQMVLSWLVLQMVAYTAQFPVK